MEKGGHRQGKRTRYAGMETVGSCRQNLESTVPVLGVTHLQLTRRLRLVRHYSGTFLARTEIGRALGWTRLE